MLKDFFSLAFGNIKHKGIRSWLTIIGIFIGITSVVALISLGNGLSLAINSQFGISTTEVITVQAGGLSAFGPPGSGAADPLTTDDLEAIERVNGIERVIRRNLRSGKLEFNDNVVFGLAANVPNGEDREFVYKQLDLSVEEGRHLKDGDSKKVFLGNNFYKNKVGLKKRVFPGNRVVINDVSFEVLGVGEKM